MKKFIEQIENIEELVNEEYASNKRSLLSGKENIENCINEEKKEGFNKSYFSTRVGFSKQSKEFRVVAIQSAYIRMLAFKKLVQEELGYENVDIDIIEFDNYTTYIRAIVHHK